jgi:hypothetical protein
MSSSLAWRRKSGHDRWLWNICKARATRNGVDFNIEIGDIIIPKRCPVLGLPLKMNSGTPRDDSATIDRINPNKGYIKGNIVVISHRANKIKSNASCAEIYKTYKWLKKLNEKYTKKYKGILNILEGES